MKATWFCLALTLSLACARDPQPETKDEDATAKHSDEPEHEELPARVHLDPDVIADAKIRTAVVKSGLLPRAMALAGEIALNPDKAARVASPVAGRVTAVRVQAGDTVAQGDVIATVRVTDIARVRAESAGAAARARTVASNAERLQTLADKGLASAQELAVARGEAEATSAEARALGEQMRALGANSGSGSEITLRSPLAGVVLSRTAVAGQPLTADETIAEVGDLSQMWFLARVFEKDLGQLTSGAKADVILNAYPDRPFAGVVEYVGQQIDPVARTLLARIRINNDANALRVGLFGTARVALDAPAEGKPVLLVPRDAVIDIGGKPSVFVAHPDGDFERHTVTLGESSLGLTEIVQGLREGEPVVVDGVFTLKSVVLKSTLAEED